MNNELYKVISTQVDYNPHTGDFTWKTNRAKNKILAGDPVGVKGNGMLKVNFTYQGSVKSVALHRLAYYILTGECPRVVYHRNGDVMDNRAINLSIDPNDKSSDKFMPVARLPRGVVAVSGGYQACPNIGGRVVKLKVYPTIEEASAKVAQWTIGVNDYFTEEA